MNILLHFPSLCLNAFPTLAFSLFFFPLQLSPTYSVSPSSLSSSLSPTQTLVCIYLTLLLYLFPISSPPAPAVFLVMLIMLTWNHYDSHHNLCHGNSIIITVFAARPCCCKGLIARAGLPDSINTQLQLVKPYCPGSIALVSNGTNGSVCVHTTLRTVCQLLVINPMIASWRVWRSKPCIASSVLK